MRAAVVTALVMCAPGCQLVFPLDETFDLIPHVRLADEFAGDVNIVVGSGESINTDSATPQGVGLGSIMLDKIAQDGDQSDLRVLRANTFRVDGDLTVTGSLPLVIIANKIEVNGLVNASGLGITTPGPGGGISNGNHVGQGILGSFDAMPNDNNGGGGGGANAPGAGAGGRIDCFGRSATEGKAGSPIGDAAVPILIGGGAGGRGGNKCSSNSAEGGAGGGAIQLSALVSITIGSAGRVIADGGGGAGGLSSGLCEVDGQDGGGAGGGAGGTIYLDAPRIENSGLIEAHGGGGGAGAVSSDPLGQSGANGTDGFGAGVPSSGGLGMPPKGQSGGAGATAGNAEPGTSNMCISENDPSKFNAGGGGGGPGRIVFRGNDLLFGTMVSPKAQQRAYGE